MSPDSTATTAGQARAIEIFDPMNPRTLNEPYQAYRALRDRCPVAFLEPLGIWAVSRYADVRSVLTAPEAFSSALAFGRDASIRDPRTVPARQLNLKFAGDSGAVVSAADGDTHARLRRMVATMLSKPRLEAAEQTVAALVGQLISALAAGQPEFDIVSDLAKPVAAQAIAGVMGLDGEVAGTLATWVDLTSRALDPGDELSGPAAGPRLMRTNLSCMRAVRAFLTSRAQISPNELGRFWSQADSPKAREEVLLSVLQLFQAGYETIVPAVSYLLAAFANGQPEPRACLPSSAGFADVIDEGLRLASPVRATFRAAVGPQVVGGVSLPDGAMVMVLLGSANRDERVFQDPGEMRPGRQVPHVVFGAGPHRCLGRFLAQLELRHILGTLMSSVTSIRAAGEARTSANILKVSYHSLPVAVEWR